MERKRLVLTLMLSLVLLAVSATLSVAASTKIYVVNNNDNTVYAIDAATHNIIETIPVGASPTGIAYNPSNKKAYVVNRGDNTVSVIDTVNNLVTGTVNVNPYPWYVAVDPGEHKIDLNKWIKQLPVHVAYVTSPVGNGIDIIVTTFDGLLSLPMGSIKTDVPPGIGAFNIAIDTNDQMAYIVNCHNSTLSILDLKQKQEVAKVENLEKADGFVGVAVDTVLDKVYAVSDGIDIMPVVDVRTGSVRSKIRVGKSPFNVTVDSSLHKAYVANRGSNTVSVVDTTNDIVEKTISVGNGPVAVALTDEKAYVTNCDSSDLSVIDRNTNEVVDIIPLPNPKTYKGLCPWGVTVF